ncbi:D-serine ammonia-lyase [Pseudoflavonifractor gallinarum]|uniref:D-serine ammonia-lyase n=1 Tax=Pseudoflavonifractor gallinarum TaxID=2779352 RepID=UPI0036F41886
MVDAQKYIQADPTVRAVAEQKETVWINPDYLPFAVTDGLCQLVVSDADIADAEARLARFAPFIQRCFPETEETQGLIESPLADIPQMQKALEETYGCAIPGRLMLKMDSHLAIAGSVKARGGIYEVLKHAEELAMAAGKLSVEDNYAKLADEDMKRFFSQYTVQVGSTGNLGMSIGIMSAALGFCVKVHMSADAKQWKKDLLRSKGVEVIEYADDYSKAVEEGRKRSDADPMSYFVDDEKSVDLFLGYAVAAKRLKHQLDELGITVDEEHPLIVYIPTGVGGAPGGVSYGLKRLFKDAVHCFLVEPTLCPSVLLGMATKEYEKANVHDFGISGITEADGLACASPSSFVTRILGNLLSGDFTVKDGKLYDYLRLLDCSEHKRIEPSSCAAFAGPCGLLELEGSKDYCARHGLTQEKLANSVQIAWATGGRLVPAEIWDQYLSTHMD